jgi:hypothetical protein
MRSLKHEKQIADAGKTNKPPNLLKMMTVKPSCAQHSGVKLRTPGRILRAAYAVRPHYPPPSLPWARQCRSIGNNKEKAKKKKVTLKNINLH